MHEEYSNCVKALGGLVDQVDKYVRAQATMVHALQLADMQMLVPAIQCWEHEFTGLTAYFGCTRDRLRALTVGAASGKCNLRGQAIVATLPASK